MKRGNTNKEIAAKLDKLIEQVQLTNALLAARFYCEKTRLIADTRDTELELEDVPEGTKIKQFIPRKIFIVEDEEARE